MKGLSKSRYTLFSQCPKALWLRTYKADVAEKDEALQARFEKGNEVGDLAMGLFGNFKAAIEREQSQAGLDSAEREQARPEVKEVTTHKEDGSLDLTKMIELTQQYMAEGVENICEASFTPPFGGAGGGYCAVDILRLTNMELKSIE